MATLYKELHIDAAPERVWDAVRDFGALHTRLVPGFVTACTVERAARTVTFFNGGVARELLVGVDESHRRLSYTSVGGRATHHHAAVQVFDDCGRTRLVWVTDVLPDELAAPIGGMVERGAQVMKATLEAAAKGP